MPSSSPSELHAYSVAALRACGWDPGDAGLIADSLVASSLRGVDSHGVVTLLPVYASAARFSAGRPDPRVVHQRGAVAVVDAEGSLGLRAARLAVDLALDGSLRSGLAAVAVRNAGYLGALWWVVEPGARRGAIMLAACNSMACVAPEGGREALHGTNPIAVAIPREPEPILFDMRTNELRMADLWQSVSSGAPLPEGAMIDANGRPVTSAADADDAVYLPLAGPKGFGLALLVDVLSAALAGGPIGRELDESGEQSARVSLFVLAIDPEFFGGSTAFAGAVDRLARQVRETAPLDPARPVRLPGDRGVAEERRRRADGIPIDRALWDRMEAELRELGVDVDALRPFTKEEI